MKTKDLHYKFDAPLNEGDTENSTVGCRANNPSICKYNSLSNICAFASDDGICKAPSKAWKKQFQKLLRETNDK